MLQDGRAYGRSSTFGGDFAMRRLRQLGFTVRFAELPPAVTWVCNPPLRILLLQRDLPPSRYRAIIRQVLQSLSAVLIAGLVLSSCW